VALQEIIHDTQQVLIKAARFTHLPQVGNDRLVNNVSYSFIFISLYL
jgi:hypothetical protein